MTYPCTDYTHAPSSLAYGSDQFFSDIFVARNATQTLQDRVRIVDRIEHEAQCKMDNLLPKLLPGGRGQGNLFIDGIFAVCRSEGPVYLQQLYQQPTPSFTGFPQVLAEWWPEGRWCNLATGGCGCGLLSLVAHFWACSPGAAYREMAGLTGIDLSASGVRQYEPGAETRFMPFPWHHAAIIPTGPHPWLGRPDACVPFHTQHGAISYWACIWHCQQESVLLFRSLHFCERAGQYNWLFASPPSRELIFNLPQLANSSGPVIIFDDLQVAASRCTPEACATWAGEQAFAGDIDWSLLRDREVIYGYNGDNPASYKLGQRSGFTSSDQQTAKLRWTVARAMPPFWGKPEGVPPLA